MPLSSRKKILELCRALRKNATPAESRLWVNLRRKNISGKKFYRQHPIVYQATMELYYFFIADFYCAESKLVIEVDGGIHLGQLEYDQEREKVIEGLGLKVIRFKNEEVLESTSNVLQEIRDALD